MTPFVAPIYQVGGTLLLKKLPFHDTYLLDCRWPMADAESAVRESSGYTRIGAKYAMKTHEWEEE